MVRISACDFQHLQNRPSKAPESHVVPRKRREEPEYHLQCQVVSWMALFHPKTLFTISPAGLKMHIVQAKKMKAMGYRKGTVDLIILEPRAEYHGLLLELKDKGGKLSEDQEKFIRDAQVRGYDCHVAFSFGEAQAIITAYLNQK